MSQVVKQLVEKDLKARYADLESVIVINVHGLNGIEANKLRGELRKKSIEMHVVKNSAARRIVTGTKLEGIGGALEGPCAFVTGPSPVDVAKELLRLVKDYPKLELRHGVVDGDKDLLTVEEISKRKGRMELIGEVLMLALSPARRLAGQLNAGGKIAGCVKAVVDKLEKGETIKQVA